MTPEKEKALKEYIQARAKILAWRDIPGTVKRFGKHWSYCASSGNRICQSPNRHFFIQQATGTSSGRIRKLKSWIGELHLTNKQAKRLGVKSHTQISPYLEKCCLIVSANVSYQNAAQDLKILTGIEVSAKTQQRLVHRQKFPLPLQDKAIQELSVDGGKIRSPNVTLVSHVFGEITKASGFMSK